VAHSLSAKKRNRQNVKHRIRNRSCKSDVRTQIKKYNSLAQQSTDAEAIQKELCLTQKKIDQLAAKGTMHKNTASRMKSQLARKLNAVKTKSS
jgi:small subunit ribosomal protein S20